METLKNAWNWYAERVGAYPTVAAIVLLVLFVAVIIF